MQIRTRCSRCSGRFVCLLCLAEYLALADDHRVESRCDPEEMLDALVVLVAIEWWSVILRRAICLNHKTTRNFVSRNPLVRNCVNLYAIACRQQQRLGTTSLPRDGFGCGIPRELLPDR